MRVAFRIAVLGLAVCVSACAQTNVRGWQAIGRALQSAGGDMQQSGYAYGRSAASIQTPLFVPTSAPAGTLDGFYAPISQAHRCVGQVPVSGPGENPCS